MTLPRVSACGRSVSNLSACRKPIPAHQAAHNDFSHATGLTTVVTHFISQLLEKEKSCQFNNTQSSSEDRPVLVLRPLASFLPWATKSRSQVVPNSDCKRRRLNWVVILPSSFLMPLTRAA